MDSQQPIVQKKKLLIVEDDFYICDIYKIEAQHRGYEVYTAGDGEEALNLARVSHPDVILLDIMLPKVNGMDVLKQLREDSSFAQTIIIMVTNVGDGKTEEDAKKIGADGYLLKVHYSPPQIMDELKKIESTKEGI